MPKLPVSTGAVRKLLREIAASGSGEHVLAVGGAPGLAPLLRQQLRRGGAGPAAVRLGDPEGAGAYVHVLTGELRAEDVAVLRRAERAGVPAIAVAVGFAGDTTIPYVLATDVVRLGAGDAFPLEAIAQAIAARLGEYGAPLAARVPLLRDAVSERLVAAFARRNGIVAAAAWIPGADLPVLALNEFRLVLRLAQAHDAPGEVGDRLPELAATLGAGFGLRALARALLGFSPGTDWVLKAAVAYGGTRALGEAARVRFALAPTRQPGGAARVAP
jgi:uncharacterized protein (DUF697 family)